MIEANVIRAFFAMLGVCLITACGAQNLAGPETTFSAKNQETLLIGGGTQSSSSLFGGCHCPYFAQVEEGSEKPTGQYYAFHSHGQNPRAYVVPAGYYVMYSWDDCTKRYHTTGPNLTLGLFADKSHNSFKGAPTFRFKANPGEVLYLGHFNGSGFYDKSEDAKKTSCYDAKC